MTFLKRPVFLLSFGHCGIDWMQSLLNQHDEILIMPVFSFYSVWRKLVDSKKLSSSQIFIRFRDYFTNDPLQLTDEGRFFQEPSDWDVFYTLLKQCNSNSRKDWFTSIHSSYLAVKYPKRNNIKVVVSHEHVSFPSNDILEDWGKDARFIIMLRDPRAAIAGYFKGMNRKFTEYPERYDYYFDKSFAEWIHTFKFWTKIKDSLSESIYMMRHEGLAANREWNMRNLAEWLEVSFNESLLISKFPNGNDWKIDSCYVSRDQIIRDETDFFSQENIKKRWMEELSDSREILMIEVVFSKLMSTFSYEKINSINLFKTALGFFYFLKPHRGPRRLISVELSEDELFRHREVSVRLRHLPKNLVKKIIFSQSVFRKLKILLFPNLINKSFS